MKIRFLFFTSIFFVISSCTKKTTACIDGPTEVEEYSSATYTWCGSNADNIEWSMNGSGVLGTGNSFTPSFSLKGKYTIVAKGTNKKYEKSTSYQVTYGRVPIISCVLTSKCGGPTPQNDVNLVKYRAYLYSSKSDWATDVSHNNHALVNDSVNCTHDNISNLALFNFKGQYPVGSIKIISVEYIDPSNSGTLTSNWSDIMANRAGTVNIQNSGFSENPANNSCTTSLDNYTKASIIHLTGGKWLLKKITKNTVTVPLGCKDGDYLKFNADGTWKYQLGPNNCNTPGSGTFSVPADPCNTGMFSSYTTDPGSAFNIQYLNYGPTEIMIDADASTSYYFSYSL